MRSRPIPSPPRPGELVHVRQRRYLVEDTVETEAPGESTLVRLACIDDDAQGQSLEVLWEKEVDPQILSAESWETLAARGFDPPRLFFAYLHTLRWNSVTATDPGLFQSPFRAGIQIDAYQLEPLRKALRLPRVNLFIADDTGLGKTIEAGLIARELLLRRKAREIVVACPPSMILQWQEEMESRFGLTFEILDRDYIARARRERGYGVNPWTTHPRFLVSHKLLIDEEYVSPLRDWLDDLRPGSLFILDEAHHAAPSSGARYAIDSKITRAIRDIARRFEHRLFLSATPHNGHSNSFSALLEILDPQRFCRGVPVQGARGKRLLDDVMVRRLKEDVREIQGGFPKRNVPQMDIDGLPEDAPELLLSALLDKYRSLREERLKDESKRMQAAAGLLICGLQQRLLSSVEAFARTLKVHRRTVDRHWKKWKEETALKSPKVGRWDLLSDGIGNDDDRATWNEADLRDEEEAQIEAATAATVGALGTKPIQDMFAKERSLLDQMTEIAEAARAHPDAKIGRLLDWIRKNMLGDDGAWQDTRIIIFTEYDDTKRYIEQQLQAAFSATDRAEERIRVFHGPTPLPTREEIKRAFNADPKKNPLRILIATDAAREGLNLQTHCWNLFHFDLPWNPSRMEQRNGRIDRKLQPHPEVNCHYFVYKQRVEDRVLQVLVEKTETIKKELGSLAQVVEGRLASTLKAGIRHRDIERLAKEIEEADIDEAHKLAVAEELEQSRQRQEELRDQIERLRDRLAKSQRWIGLVKEDFRSALNCSLGLLGADPLDGRSLDGGSERYTFPPLDRMKGADPTWAEVMDSLRVPRPRDQKMWEWRKESPIREVVFTDPGVLAEDLVHLHLEHRIVRRLLGRFTAQGFVHHDLSRACLAQTKDVIPRVVLLGRLALYGAGGARLHEEVIPLTARWTDPKDRKGSLSPYGRTAEARTIQLLEEATAAEGKGVTETVSRRLKEAAPRDIQELLPQLQARAEELGREHQEALRRRAEQEADEMRKILEAQRESVSREAAKYEDPQLSFDFNDEETRQLQANRRHWQRRLEALEKEIVDEPIRILHNYDVKASRIEPIGLVYLWPVTN